MRVAVLAGLGTALPRRVVANEEIAAALGTTDEWIRRRTGIAARYAVEPGTTTADLATAAGRHALKSAGTSDVDAVVVATSTPDRLSPATAPEVASRLGLTGGVAAFDVAAVCTGFVYGLATAAGLVAAGIAQRVLLVGAETNTYFLRYTPEGRSCAIIFGDGAGAVVLRAGDAAEPGALAAFELGSDGTGADLVTIDGGARRHGDPPAWSMAGQEVFRRAIVQMAASAEAVLTRAGLGTADVDRFVAHQANQRILDAVAIRLGIPPEHQLGNVARVGNTGAASIPLALADAVHAGDLRAGHQLLMTAFGGGLTWGSALLTWPEVEAVADHL